MNNFFCADASRQVGEDIVGSAPNFLTYVLVECPAPWTPEAFDSKSVPPNLKNLVYEIKKAKLSVRLLLIERAQPIKSNQTKILIYEQQKDGLSKGYIKKEFNVKNIDDVAAVVQQYLVGKAPHSESEHSETRDILVCTHGSHDKCCARYGNPFYAKAVATASDLSLSNVRLWKSSHFGGHRFAPTAIDLPEGRYYGALDQESFRSILTRTGDVQCLNRVYRGWGILPQPVQALERELILRYGWDWFNYNVKWRIIDQNLDKTEFQAELTFENPDGAVHCYQAKLVKDESKTLRLQGSCNAIKESEFVKYSVKSLYFCHGKEAMFKYINMCGISRNSKGSPLSEKPSLL